MVIAAVLITSVPSVVFAGDKADDSMETIFFLAKNKGPILWYIRDEDKRKIMENDMELMRLYNQAQKALKRRRAISAGLFYPGVAIMGIGICGGLFQNTIGLYDDTTGQQVLIGGTLIGAALVIPGIVFRARESKAEKVYKSYIRKKYDVIPIMRKDDNGNTFYSLNIAGRF